jgi:AcrR family transcriptional regulator
VSGTTAAPAGPLERLPPGRHGLTREQVRESQRQRLIAAATETLAEHGYGQIGTTAVAKRAGVSTATFYKRFDDLWACLLAAYEAAAERLCERIEGACAAVEVDRAERGRAGIEGALALLASEPALTHLLSADPPSQATPLWAARQRLTDRLSAMLHGAKESPGDTKRETRLVGGAFALVSIRARAESTEQLEDLAPALIEFLLAP